MTISHEWKWATEKISLMILGHGTIELLNQGKKNELIKVIDVLLASLSSKSHPNTLPCFRNLTKNDNIRYFILEESLCRDLCIPFMLTTFTLKGQE